MARKPDELSHADKIRARRKIEPIRRRAIERTPEESTVRATQAASRVVTRRQYSETNTNVHTQSSRGGRPIYIPTGTPGKEIRLGTVPRFRVNWRIISGLLAFICVVMLILMLSSDSFKVNPNGINIRGNFRVTDSEISNKLSRLGTLIISVNPKTIEYDLLNSFRDLKSVRVGVSLPANLNVRVEERIPAIIWHIDATEESEGSQIWIDEEGFSFEVRGIASLPIEVFANTTPPEPFRPFSLETPSEEDKEENEPVYVEPEPDVDPKLVRAIQTLYEIKPPDTVLRFDAKRGLGWTDPNHGWMVYFGRTAKHLDLKLAQYQKIAQYLLERNLQPSLISLEYLHAPYYR